MRSLRQHYLDLIRISLIQQSLVFLSLHTRKRLLWVSTSKCYFKKLRELYLEWRQGLWTTNFLLVAHSFSHLFIYSNIFRVFNQHVLNTSYIQVLLLCQELKTGLRPSICACVLAFKNLKEQRGRLPNKLKHFNTVREILYLTELNTEGVLYSRLL